jgi:phosphoribosylamine--glycine ligase
VRVLVVGKGARENALCWSISQSPTVSEVHAAPGNPGIAQFADCHEVAADDIPSLTSLAQKIEPDLTVIGPEAPLAAGLADKLADRGYKVFGPGASGARLESSKSFAKSLMRVSGIPTAAAADFDRSEDAIRYLRGFEGPVVVKADGLAEGKGVTVCDDPAQAEQTVKEIMDDKKFGAAGNRVLIEERLKGEEISALAFFDGHTIVPMEPAQDYKRVFDSDVGPNTGGMGSYSPVPSCGPRKYKRIVSQILEPIGAALSRRNIRYRGVIYAGLMLTTSGPKVIEFNCRFGDPEAQALIPRLDSDIVEALAACADGSLSGVKLRWRDDACVCVVAASHGYPGSYETGKSITGLDAAAALTGIPVFHAGTAISDGQLKSAGGRVLAVSALGYDHAAARQLAYQAIDKVSFEGIHFRSDIARRAVKAA